MFDRFYVTFNCINPHPVFYTVIIIIIRIEKKKNVIFYNNIKLSKNVIKMFFYFYYEHSLLNFSYWSMIVAVSNTGAFCSNSMYCTSTVLLYYLSILFCN